MDHETVLRTEIKEMGRPVLVVRVPAKESVDLRAVRSFVMDSLALGVLVVGQGVGLSLEYLPKLGGVACTWSDPWADDEQDESDEAPDDEIEPDDPPFPRYVAGMEPRKRTRSWPGLLPTGRPMDWDAWQRWLGWLGSRLPMN